MDFVIEIKVIMHQQVPALMFTRLPNLKGLVESQSVPKWYQASEHGLNHLVQDDGRCVSIVTVKEAIPQGISVTVDDSTTVSFSKARSAVSLRF